MSRAVNKLLQPGFMMMLTICVQSHTNCGTSSINVEAAYKWKRNRYYLLRRSNTQLGSPSHGQGAMYSHMIFLHFPHRSAGKPILHKELFSPVLGLVPMHACLVPGVSCSYTDTDFNSVTTPGVKPLCTAHTKPFSAFFTLLSVAAPVL